MKSMGSSIPQPTVDQALKQLMDKIKVHIPSADHVHITSDAKPREFKYSCINDVVLNAEQYAIHAACALHNALQGMRDHQLLEKPRNILELGMLKGKLEVVEKHLRSLDEIYYPKYNHDKVKEFKPFEVVRVAEKEFHLKNENANFEIEQKSIVMKGKNIEFTYRLNGGKPKKEVIKANRSWTPLVVNKTTHELALLMKEFAVILNSFPIPPAVKGLDIFKEMQLVFEHIVDDRIDHYLATLEADRQEQAEASCGKLMTVAQVSKQLGIEGSLSVLQVVPQENVPPPAVESAISASQEVVSSPAHESTEVVEQRRQLGYASGT